MGAVDGRGNLDRRATQEAHLKVICYFEPRYGRSLNIAEAMAAGARRHGHNAIVTSWHDPKPGDIAIGYGWKFADVFSEYKQFIYIDLGWWGRKPKRDELNGYHKVVVNGREPTEYFRNNFPSDRFDRFGIDIRPWRKGGDQILLAGMSGKSAGTRGFGPLEWEQKTIEEIRRHTDKPIVYRPKPSWKDAEPIPGTVFSSPDESLTEVLDRCAGIVTLHSNVAVDALIHGVPVHAEQGVGSALSCSSIAELVDGPGEPGDRAGLMNDIAYCQWNPDEMKSGDCWDHLARDTVLCT